jgi:acyl dehydratase
MKQGDKHEYVFSFSQEEVEQFAQLTGDKNPIHLDAAYAAQTQFKKPIMHGMISACVFSKVLGMDFPGEGTVYLKQSLQFKRPMYAGETYTATFEVLETNAATGVADIATCVKWNGKVMVEGVAQVMNKTAFA